MDPKDHKRLADNAYQKAVDIFESKDKQQFKEMVHFAHAARLHYSFSSFDPKEKEMNQNIQKCDTFIHKMYLYLELHQMNQFLESEWRMITKKTLFR